MKLIPKVKAVNEKLESMKRGFINMKMFRGIKLEFKNLLGGAPGWLSL